MAARNVMPPLKAANDTPADATRGTATEPKLDKAEAAATCASAALSIAPIVRLELVDARLPYPMSDSVLLVKAGQLRKRIVGHDVCGCEPANSFK